MLDSSAPGRHPGDAPTDDAMDAILRLVNHPVRRAVLAYLADDPNRTLPLDEVVEQVGGDLPDEGDEQLALQLHHVHVPVLAEAGVVEFDHRRGLLRYHPDDALEALLSGLQSWGVPRE